MPRACDRHASRRLRGPVEDMPVHACKLNCQEFITMLVDRPAGTAGILHVPVGYAGHAGTRAKAY